MAFEGNLQAIPGLSASADLSAKQFRFMKMSGDATVTVTAAITDKLMGVLQDTPTSGQPANVAAFGASKLLLGGTVVAGDLVGTDNAGKGVAIVAGTDTTQYVGGRCLVGGVSGDIGVIEIAIGGRAT
jgi:hypothetical protein